MIVGHGPSILSGLGAVIDSHETVIRLKGCPTEPEEHFGTRTDILCARSHIFEKPGVKFWLADPLPGKWGDYYRQYGRYKPSTGLCAVFCALEYLKPREISLIGFDRLLRDGPGWKWNDPPHVRRFVSHDGAAESACLQSLPVRIVDLVKVCRL